MSAAPIQSLTVESNTQIARDTWELTLSGARGVASPGQFLNLHPAGFLLRRPISIADASDNGYTVIYKTVGEGTREFTALQPGATVSAHGPLGHGFDLPSSGHAVLYGGGVGVPPMYYLAKELTDNGVSVDIRLGFSSADAAFYLDKFAELGIVRVATDDATLGVGGTVAALDEALGAEQREGPAPDAVFACGPNLMLQYVAQRWTDHPNVQLSFEERMACGVGACYGCVKPTTWGQARLCVEGPVLAASEVVW